MRLEGLRSKSLCCESARFRFWCSMGSFSDTLCDSWCIHAALCAHSRLVHGFALFIGGVACGGRKCGKKSSSTCLDPLALASDLVVLASSFLHRTRHSFVALHINTPTAVNGINLGCDRFCGFPSRSAIGSDSCSSAICLFPIYSTRFAC